jgi:transketolase
LREEDRRYRDYLAQLKHEEAAREAELERLCDAEVEKMWEKRVKQWRLEKEARRKLLQEVMQSRRVQLQEKCKLIMLCPNVLKLCHILWLKGGNSQFI